MVWYIGGIVNGQAKKYNGVDVGGIDKRCQKRQWW